MIFKNYIGDRFEVELDSNMDGSRYIGSCYNLTKEREATDKEVEELEKDYDDVIDSNHWT